MAGWAGFIDDAPGAPDLGARAAILARMAQLLAHRGHGAPCFHDDGLLALVHHVDSAGGGACRARAGRVLACDGAPSEAGVASELADRDHPTPILARLRAGFALASWDLQRRRLLLARDALGLRPLVYAAAPGLLLFGSELKALLAHPGCPRRLDWSVLDAALPLAPVGVAGAHHLTAGHSVDVGPGECVRPRPWCLDEPAPPPAFGSHSEAVDEGVARLTASVRARLAGARRVGVLIDGLASVVSAACAAAAGSELELCARIDRPGALSSGAARALGRALGVEVRPLATADDAPELTAEGALALLEWAVWLCDSPLIEPEGLLRHEWWRRARMACPQAPSWLSDAGAALCDEMFPPRARTRRLAGARVPGELLPLLAPSFPPGAPGDDPASERAEALRALRDEGLRAAERYGASALVDVCYPWLDPSVLELGARLCAASAAPGAERGRWWRALAARLLPGAPAWPALDLEDGERPAGAERLRHLLVKRAFPAFHREYLARRNGLFAADAMTAAFRAGCGARAQPGVLRWLFRAMALTIFERQCAAPPDPPVVSAPALPLEALTASPEAGTPRS